MLSFALHHKDLFGNSTWLQQDALMQLKFALVMPNIDLRQSQLHPEQIYCDWEQHLPRWFFWNFCRICTIIYKCFSGRSDLSAAGLRPNPAGIGSELYWSQNSGGNVSTLESQRQLHEIKQRTHRTKFQAANEIQATKSNPQNPLELTVIYWACGHMYSINSVKLWRSHGYCLNRLTVKWFAN